MYCFYATRMRRRHGEPQCLAVALRESYLPLSQEIIPLRPLGELTNCIDSAPMYETVLEIRPATDAP
jgi:hypothetical protein